MQDPAAQFSSDVGPSWLARLHMPDSSSFDKQRIRRNFTRAAAGYDAAAAVSGEVCARLLERLDLMTLIPERILDAGSGTGVAAGMLTRRYPRAHINAVDLTLPMLRVQPRTGRWGSTVRAALGRGSVHRVCGDFERLPLRSGAIDLVASNLALHWSDQPASAFAEMHRVLRPGGLLAFTTFGPDTLKELAQASAFASERSLSHRFVDMHDLGDLLIASGFAAPVMEMEYLTLTYARFDDLLRDLRASGALSVRRDRLGLRTPRWRERIAQRYEALRRDGRLPATLEVVYGHAWKPEDAARGSGVTRDGHAIVRFERPRRKP